MSAPASPSVQRPVYLVVHPGAELYGSDRMALESVAGLVDSGGDVVVALPGDGPLVAELQRAGARVVIVPLLVLRKSLLKPSGWGTLVSLTMRGWVSGRRLVRKLRPSALYVSTITLPQWPVLGAILKVPVISHVHEAESSAPRIVNVALYSPHLISKAVIVNSEFSKETLGRVFPRMSRGATVVYNGVASPNDPPCAREHITDGPRILFLGRLSPRKGPEDVLHAAVALRERGVEVQVGLLGSAFDGYEWFDAELHDIVAREGLADVTFLGFESDIWPRIAQYDIVIVPSRVDEPFGNTAVEGILSERVLIATDTSGLREAAGGYETVYFVPPSNPAAIADAVESIVADWDRLRSLLPEDRTRAVRRHDPATYRSRIGAIVSAAARPTPPATGS